MTKIFISQPMNSRSNEEILEERQGIINACIEEYGEDVEIIDSFFKDAPHDAKPAWFLGKSIELLSSADKAFFADGWKDARGCAIEHEVADKYGIEIIYDGGEDDD